MLRQKTNSQTEMEKIIQKVSIISLIHVLLNYILMHPFEGSGFGKICVTSEALAENSSHGQQDEKENVNHWLPKEYCGQSLKHFTTTNFKR